MYNGLYMSYLNSISKIVTPSALIMILRTFDSLFAYFFTVSPFGYTFRFHPPAPYDFQSLFEVIHSCSPDETAWEILQSSTLCMLATLFFMTLSVHDLGLMPTTSMAGSWDLSTSVLYRRSDPALTPHHPGVLKTTKPVKNSKNRDRQTAHLARQIYLGVFHTKLPHEFRAAVTDHYAAIECAPSDPLRYQSRPQLRLELLIPEETASKTFLRNALLKYRFSSQASPPTKITDVPNSEFTSLRASPKTPKLKSRTSSTSCPRPSTGGAGLPRRPRDVPRRPARRRRGPRQTTLAKKIDI